MVGSLIHAAPSAVLVSEGGILTTDLLLKECLRRLAPHHVNVDMVRKEILQYRGSLSSEPAVRDEEPQAVLAMSNVEATGSLREAMWARQGDKKMRVNPRTRLWPTLPAWSKEVHEAIQYSLAIAEGKGLNQSATVHLLIALLDGQDSRAIQVMRGCGLEPGSLQNYLNQTRAAGRGSRPWTPALDLLEGMGFTGPGGFLPQALASFLCYRAKKGAPGGLLLHVLQAEAARHSVRLGHSRIAPVHLLLAVISLANQVAQRSAVLRVDLAPRCEMLPVLSSLQLPMPAIAAKATDLDVSTLELSSLGIPIRRQSPPWTGRSQVVSASHEMIMRRY
jgi:hypothetical protein